MWILLSIGFDGSGNTTIRVSFSKYRVYGTTENSGITSLDGSLFVIFGFVRIKRYIISFRAKLGDAGVELRDAS